MCVFIKADSNTHITLRFLIKTADAFFHLCRAISLKIDLRRDSSRLHDDNWSPVSSYALSFSKDFKIEIILNRSGSVSVMMNEGSRNTSWDRETYRESILSWLKSLRTLKDCELGADCLLLVCEMNRVRMLSSSSLLCPMNVFKPIYDCINGKFRTRVVNR